jgi:hypothetical protein
MLNIVFYDIKDYKSKKKQLSLILTFQIYDTRWIQDGKKFLHLVLHVFHVQRIKQDTKKDINGYVYTYLFTFCIFNHTFMF